MWPDKYISIGALHFSSCHTQPLIINFSHLWTHVDCSSEWKRTHDDVSSPQRSGHIGVCCQSGLEPCIAGNSHSRQPIRWLAGHMTVRWPGDRAPSMHEPAATGLGWILRKARPELTKELEGTYKSPVFSVSCKPDQTLPPAILLLLKMSGRGGLQAEVVL